MKKPYNPKANLVTIYTVNREPVFLQCYNLSRTVRAPHPCLTDYLAQPEPIARTSYKGPGRKQGFIATYRLKGTREEIIAALLTADKEPDFREVHDHIFPEELEGGDIESPSAMFGRPDEEILKLGPEIDKQYNISCVYVDSDLATKLILAQRHDIARFCRGKPAKVQDTTAHYVCVDEVPLDPGFSLITPGQHAVIKEGKGRFESTCIIDIGFDGSIGCLSNTTPEGTYETTGKCSYCYAHQSGPCFSDTLFDIDEGWLKERLEQKIEEMNLKGRIYFRLGQTTETHIPKAFRKWPGFRDNLSLVLRVLAESDHDFRCAMPTKTPEFDEKLAELLKAANVSMLTSIAYEDLEKGMVRHGFTVEKRLEEAWKFREEGVNSNIYIATDITRAREFMQPEAKRAEQFAKEREIPIQFLDIRVTRKSDAQRITGSKWEDLPQLKRNHSHKASLFNSDDAPEEPRWGQTGQSYLRANVTHPDWLKLVKKNRGNTRLCSTHVRKCERRCGKCFMD
ncbi:hypothetical protein KY329_05710 [Candidatus Woesearchaeota archaeon]|nr:hypothetical protein [Candidatus Woesearchaeota archaeon]